MKKTRKKYYRNDKFLKKIGDNIRHYRTEKGMTQMELAFACGDIDYSQINRIELGKVNFTISYLSLIATVLEISPEDILK
ncbi:MAG: helix-turn-helix transcriptional regulator [Chitinophagaceae bacterium]